MELEAMLRDKPGDAMAPAWKAELRAVQNSLMMTNSCIRLALEAEGVRHTELGKEMFLKTMNDITGRLGGAVKGFNCDNDATV